MTTPHAGQYGPESFSDVHTGRLLRNTPAALYDVGTTTARTRYSDRARTTTVTVPLTTDDDGNLVVFAEPGPADLVIANTRLTIVVPPDAEDLAALLAGPADTGVHRYFGAQMSNVDDLVAFAAEIAGEGLPDGSKVFLPVQSNPDQIGGYTLHVPGGDVAPSVELTDPAGSFQPGDLVIAGGTTDQRFGLVWAVGDQGLVRVNDDTAVRPAYAGVDPVPGSDGDGPLLTIRDDVLSSALIFNDVGPKRVTFGNPGPGKWATVLLVIVTTVSGAQITWVGGNVNHGPQPLADPGSSFVQVLVTGTESGPPDLDFAGLLTFPA